MLLKELEIFICILILTHFVALELLCDYLDPLSIDSYKEYYRRKYIVTTNEIYVGVALIALFINNRGGELYMKHILFLILFITFFMIRHISSKKIGKILSCSSHNRNLEKLQKMFRISDFLLFITIVLYIIFI